MTRRLTASKAGLAFRCSYWLNDSVPLDDSPPGPAADEGTVLHALIEHDLRGSDGALAYPVVLSPEGALRVERKFAVWQAWAKKERRLGWRPEIALSYDPKSDSARELVQKHHRDYSGVKPGEVAMQLDVVSMDADEEGPLASCIDWKSGRAVEGSETNGQMNVAALAVARALNVDRVRVRLVYVGEEGVTEDPFTLSALDFDMTRHRLRQITTAPDAAPVPGAHCTTMYCAARHQCAATVTALAQVVGAPMADMRKLVATALKTPEDAGHAYTKLRLVKDAVKAVEERIKAIVETQGDAPTEDGKVLRLVDAKRTNVDGKKALGMLRDLGADVSGLTSETTYSMLKECKR